MTAEEFAHRAYHKWGRDNKLKCQMRASASLTYENFDGFSVRFFVANKYSYALRGRWIRIVRYRILIGETRIEATLFEDDTDTQFVWRHEPSDADLVKAKLVGAL